MAAIDLRYTKLPLRYGAGELPALGFGTLIPDERAAGAASRQHSKQDSDTSIARNAIVTSRLWAMPWGGF